MLRAAAPRRQAGALAGSGADRRGASAAGGTAARPYGCRDVCCCYGTKWPQVGGWGGIADFLRLAGAGDAARPGLAPPRREVRARRAGWGWLGPWIGRGRRGGRRGGVLPENVPAGAGRRLPGGVFAERAWPGLCVGGPLARGGGRARLHGAGGDLGGQPGEVFLDPRDPVLDPGCQQGLHAAPGVAADPAQTGRQRQPLRESRNSLRGGMEGMRVHDEE